MRLTTFSAGGDGESHFSEVEIDLPHERVDAFGHTIASSTTFTSTRAQFVVLPAGLDQDWHPAPRRQIVTILSGRVEVDTPDGEQRSFGPGEAFLADDVAHPWPPDPHRRRRGHDLRGPGPRGRRGVVDAYELSGAVASPSAPRSS